MKYTKSYLTNCISMRSRISYVNELYLNAETMTFSSKFTQPASVTQTFRFGMVNFRRPFP